MNQTQNKRNSQSVQFTAKLAITAMFGALAALLMLVELPIFFTLPFIKLDFSDVPVILGAYTLGLPYGCAVGFIKIALNFMLNGTATGGIGELANLLFTLAYVIPAVLVYQRLRTKKGAILSLSLATIFASIAAVVLDWIWIFEVYMDAFGLDMKTLLGMASGTNSLVKDEFSLMMVSVFPANLLKYFLESVITFFAYSPLRRLINSFMPVKKSVKKGKDIKSKEASEQKEA